MLTIVIQARTGSTRLPDKVVRPFFQRKSILEIILNKIKKFGPAYRIIVATTLEKEDEVIADLAKRMDVEVFRGDTNNVLRRMVDAVDGTPTTHIVRVCADNPFLSTEALETLIKKYEEDPGLDYMSFRNGSGTPVIKTHFGLFCEIASVSALNDVSKHTSDPFYFEHVTLYLYSHPDQFDVRLIDLPRFLSQRSDLRFTIDTESDFDTMQNLYLKEELRDDVRRLVEYVDEHPAVLESMKANIELNTK